MQNNYQKRHWPQWLIPTLGSTSLTLLIIGTILWAQSVGAITLNIPNAPTATSVTNTIPYQGYLTDSNEKPLTGPHDMNFCLYNSAEGETALWCEQWNGDNQVQLDEGLFNVLLGSLNAMPQRVTTNNGYLYLGIAIDNDSELTPRIQVDWFEREPVTDVWYESPTSIVNIQPHTGWTDIQDTTLTFSLYSKAQVFLTYSINVHPSGAQDGSALYTRLEVDGVPHGSSGSHYQPFSSGDSNVNLNGNLVLELEPGAHTVQLQWLSAGNTVSWASSPEWGGGYGGARTITAIAFYR